MIIEQRIKQFEKFGLGVFVHFGLYSVIGRGEWAKKNCNIPWNEYLKSMDSFNPDSDWAQNIVRLAKQAGARYITLTARHHDGFSLYDTCGLNSYDAPHCCGRDLIREFVDACRSENIIPFFYHTLVDWHEELYKTDFSLYLEYLRKSVKLLCTNYGKIGGLWFDGMWDKPDADWQEDALYGMIRQYQPEAMIINNTGLDALGALGHIELDSVTFERGRPAPINLDKSPKYIASEMCQIFCDHWGYAKDDLNFKSPADIIRDLVNCRRYGSNLLINLGPMADGKIRPIDHASLEILGQWVEINGEMLSAAPCDIEVFNRDDTFLLKTDCAFYLLCDGLPMVSDPNVAIKSNTANYTVQFHFTNTVKSISWLDDNSPVEFSQDTDGLLSIVTKPFEYGRNLVVRVAKIIV